MIRSYADLLKELEKDKINKQREEEGLEPLKEEDDKGKKIRRKMKDVSVRNNKGCKQRR